MVKKLFLITGFLVLAVAAGLLAPMPKNLISSYQGLPFKAYCPMYNLLIPTPKLSQNIDRYTEQWSTGFFPFVASFPSEKFACAAKIIMDRGEEYDFITIPLLHVKSDRPDLYAYFTHRLFDTGGQALSRDLSELYFAGEGVSKNEEKAKHLFRLDRIYHFSSKETDGECTQTFNQDIKATNNDFEKQQIEWFQNLCTAPKKELYNIASFYMERESDHYYPEISEGIYGYLYTARKDKEVKSLYEKSIEAQNGHKRF